MANIYINNSLVSTDDSILEVANVKFNYLTNKIYSATKIERAYGIFVSNIIIANESFIRWNDLSWVGQIDAVSMINLFIRSSDSEAGINDSEWMGPYSNSGTDISSQEGKYIQFMAVLRNDTGLSPFPIINSINVSFLSMNNLVQFFTKTFRIGFVPKQILLTYNATNVDDDSIIRFAVSGTDTIDPAYYMYIDPNKIEDLYEIGFDSGDIKIMLELGGVSGTDIAIDEFALMLSGDTANRINKSP